MAALAVALLYLSVATSIAALSVARFDIERSAGPDIAQYLAMYEGVPLDEVQAPYRYRVVVPWAARAVPVPPDVLFSRPDPTGERPTLFRFAALNLVGLAAAAWFLFLMMLRLGFSAPESVIGGALFLCCLQPLTIGTLPLVDAWSYALLAGCLFALVRGRLSLLFALFSVGLFTKETILLVPVAALLLPASRRDRMRQLAAFAPALVAYLLFRLVWFPADGLYSVASSRRFFFDVFVSGEQLPLLSRGLRSFGLLWPLAFYGWVALRDERDHALKRWSPLVPLILLLPFLLALNVGRVWFFAFPVVLPLAVAGLSSLWSGGPTRLVEPTRGVG
jgi:hypothetical protein